MPRHSLLAVTEQPSKADTLVRMASHALVVGATLPLGPTGQVLGAAGSVLFDAAAEADRRVWRRFDRMVEDASADAGLTANELHEWAGASDEHLNFIRQLVSAALTTLDEQKARALGRVLTDVMIDDALLHDRPMIVRTLSDLDPVHVLLLRSMLYDDNPQDSDVKGVANGATTVLSAHRWTYSALLEKHPRIHSMLMANVLATLERHGLIRRQQLADDTYSPAAYAVPVLNYLSEQADPPGSGSRRPGSSDGD